MGKAKLIPGPNCRAEATDFAICWGFRERCECLGGLNCRKWAVIDKVV